MAVPERLAWLCEENAKLKAEVAGLGEEMVRLRGTAWAGPSTGPAPVAAQEELSSMRTLLEVLHEEILTSSERLCEEIRRQWEDSLAQEGRIASLQQVVDQLKERTSLVEPAPDNNTSFKLILWK